MVPASGERHESATPSREEKERCILQTSSTSRRESDDRYGEAGPTTRGSTSISSSLTVTYAVSERGTATPAVSGSAVVVNHAIPQNRVLVLNEWDSVIEESGLWTMELLTETPFGIDRLHYVTFTINRDIEVNGTVTTVE